MFASRKIWLNCLLPSTVALAVAIAPMAIPQSFAQGQEQNLSEAREHYKKGSALFSKGDYQAAIGEFASADKLSHSPLLEYNIALCYDRLGESSEALRRYRSYLKEAPNSSNRQSVEGKIKRLEGVLRSEDAARAAAAAAAVPAPATAVPAPTTGVPAPATGVPAPTTGVPAPSTGVPSPATGVPTPAAVGGVEPLAANPVYKPDTVPTVDGTASTSYTGSDPGLVRVSAIDVAAIRDQRNLGNRSGAAAASGEPGAPNEGALVPPPESDKSDTPFYKEWWFWVVAGVGVVVLINIASTDDESQPVNRARTRMITLPGSSSSSFGAAPGGLQWRF